MGIMAILQLIMALPGLIRMVKEIIDLIRGLRDGDEKVIAEAELDAIKFEILRKKRVGRLERERLENLRARLRERKNGK